MDEMKLRAWWAHRQGLDGTLEGKSPGAVLQSTGWARSVGGAGPYLTLFSRAGTSRQAADKAAAGLEIHEIPAARGCTYVVPAADYAVALKAGQGFDDEIKTASKLGVTETEIDRLCAAVLAALSGGPLDPDEIRDQTGAAVRNLGEEGKRKGLTTTLPVALGRLQSSGEIRRVPVNGRFDQQRYRYTLWQPNPLARSHLSAEEAYAEMARRYFSWIGPASISEFQWFSGLGVKATKAALDHLSLEPVDPADPRLMFVRDRAEFREFVPPSRAQFVLVGSLDSISLLRRDLRTLMDPGDHTRKVMTSKGAALAGGLTDLPSHAILDRGRVVGLWEYDVETESIAWMSFIGKNKALEDAVKRTEHFVRSDLGDARSFSLDSPKSRAPRIRALRSQ